MTNNDYQSIGAVSPELDAAVAPCKGWQHAAAIPQSEQVSSHDTSFWNRRANRQDLGAGTGNSYAEDFFGPQADGSLTDPLPRGLVRGENAGYGNLPPGEHPTAGYDNGPIQPFKGYSEAGIIDGAQASAEQSGNIGLSAERDTP